MGPVGPLVRLVHEALREGLPVGVDRLGHVQQVVLLGVDKGVQPVLQEAAVRHRRYRPSEKVVVSWHLRQRQEGKELVSKWKGGGMGEGGGGGICSIGRNRCFAGPEEGGRVRSWC